MMCLPKALVNLNPSLSPRLPEVLTRHPVPWTDLVLVYVGYTFGMFFTPFMLDKFSQPVYQKYNGILVGRMSDGSTHGVAKIDGELIDSDGSVFRGVLTGQIFFAWTNQTN